MKRRSLPTVLVLVGLLAGCSSGAGAPQAANRPVPVDVATPAGVASPQPSAAPASPSSSPSASPSPAPSASPPAPPYDARLLQQQLSALKYYIGPVNGLRDATVRSAVMAFQKVNRLPADGTVGPRTAAALAAPRIPVLKDRAPANRVEVDLTLQVLYVVKAGQISRILPVSSGNGQTYPQKNGQLATALTPVGHYTIQRRFVGPEKAYLGTLYDPQYFYRGWAIHGSNSVPAGPASHGCIRVTRADSAWLLGQLTVGLAVYVYGGTFTFVAGSSAPGTDTPTGDTPADAPSPSPAAPSPASASPRPAATPTPTPSATPSPTPTPSRSSASAARLAMPG